MTLHPTEHMNNTICLPASMQHSLINDLFLRVEMVSPCKFSRRPGGSSPYPDLVQSIKRHEHWKMCVNLLSLL